MRSCVGEPTFCGFRWFQVFGVPVGFHVTFVKRAAGVQEHAHAVVSVVSPPDANSCCSVEAEVFHARHSPSMRETTSGWKYHSMHHCAVDVPDVSGQQLFVQELLGGAVDQFR
jgi:hypothetical protein